MSETLLFVGQRVIRGFVLIVMLFVAEHASANGVDSEQLSDAVKIESRDDMIVYRWVGPLDKGEAAGLCMIDGVLWTGSSKGLLRYVPGETSVTVYRWPGFTEGKNKCSVIGAWGGEVIVDVVVWEPKVNMWRSGAGAYYFKDQPGPRWRQVNTRASGMPRDADGEWVMSVSSNQGVVLSQASPRRTIFGTQGRYTALAEMKEASNFLVVNDIVWLTRFDGQYAGNKVIPGGVRGVSLRGDHSVAILKDNGLADSYCYGLASDGARLWVSHWTRQRGLTAIDLENDNACRIIKTSGNGVELGGVRLLYVNGVLWIDDCSTLIRYEVDKDFAAEIPIQSRFPAGCMTGLVAAENGDIWTIVTGKPAGVNSDPFSVLLQLKPAAAGGE